MPPYVFTVAFFHSFFHSFYVVVALTFMNLFIATELCYALVVADFLIKRISNVLLVLSFDKIYFIVSCLHFFLIS